MRLQRFIFLVKDLWFYIKDQKGWHEYWGVKRYE